MFELAMAIRSGELSPVEHVDDVLKRLDGDTCNAVVLLLAEQARRAARERADELVHGHWRGPLHGIAVAVKDMMDVEGVPTRCGSAVRRDAPPARADAAVVARLKAAGAVIVAKTHTHEFAYGPTGDVAAEGPARNPHDPTRITGGSSSGSAAVVAAGHLPLALGTDTGCSVRTPAALCGVVGLKPRHGRLTTDGIFPLSETCDHVGLLACDTHTAAVCYDLLSGVLSGLDATGGGIQESGVRGVVVGVPTDPYWRAVDPMITEAVGTATRRLADAGAEVVPIETPDIDELAATYRRIIGAEAYTTHAAALATRREDFQPITAERLLASRDQSAADYVQAQRTRRRLTAELRRQLSTIDVLLTPTTPIRATPIGATEAHGVQVRSALLSLALPFNLTGWPAVSVPVPPEDGGLPAGVQLVGVRFEERALLRVASEVGQCGLGH
jgi:Asp-tRNA(Asn)/Glu-tRNA(Gln) amidotransferase A subunit family amidase